MLQKFIACAGALAALTSTALSQESEHRFFSASGPWHLISNVNAVTLHEDFWMGQSDISEKKAIWSLDCSVEQRSYNFVIGQPSLSYIPFGQQVVLAARIEHEKPLSLAAVSAGNGNIIVREIQEQPSFTALLGYITFRGPATELIGFSVGAEQYFFSLTGFLTTANQLGKLCGFNPDPARARRQPR